MTVRYKKFVTVDELTEAQQRHLFENSEDVREYINRDVDYFWRDTVEETIDCLLDGHPLWSKMFAGVTAGDFCWEQDCGEYRVWLEGRCSVRFNSAIDFHTYEQLVQEYPKLKPQHVFLINRGFGALRWSEPQNTEQVYDSTLGDWLDERSVVDSEASPEDVQDAVMEALDYEKTADDSPEQLNEWVVYEKSQHGANTIMQSEHPFFAGMHLSELLPDADAVMDAYHEAARWMLHWAGKIRKDIEDAINSEWKYRHSFECWLDAAINDEVEFELTEELENVA